MPASVYRINKGINKPIEFKGLVAQYIWYVAGGVIALLVLYAIMYIIGVNTYASVGIIVTAGAGWIIYVYQLSNKYGEYGLMKKAAQRGVPGIVRCYSRKQFINIGK